jgi:hypothetical protein
MPSREEDNRIYNPFSARLAPTHRKSAYLFRVSECLGRWYDDMIKDFSKMGRNIHGEIQNIDLHARPAKN